MVTNSSLAVSRRPSFSPIKIASAPGGVYSNGILNLLNATVAFNQANSSGGILSPTLVNVTTVTKSRNTIISNNSANSAPDYSGILTSRGYNLIGNTTSASITGNTKGNLLNVNPLLDPVLSSAGNSTPTHALLPNSPAIDKRADTADIMTDQRGLPRPFDFPSIPNAAGGDGSDIGAFERQNIKIARNTTFDFDGDGKADISVFRPGSGAWYLLNSQTGFSGLAFRQRFGQISACRLRRRRENRYCGVSTVERHLVSAAVNRRIHRHRVRG